MASFFAEAAVNWIEFAGNGKEVNLREIQPKRAFERADLNAKQALATNNRRT